VRVQSKVMTIKFFADIRGLTGGEEQQWTKPTPTLRALLSDLSAQHGAAFAKRVFDGDRLNATIIIMVNGRNVVHLGGLETPLQPDDVVVVFPMVAGG
jgi:sulfur-carrier protein